MGGTAESVGGPHRSWNTGGVSHVEQDPATVVSFPHSLRGSRTEAAFAP